MSPTYPSLASISSALNGWGIDNEGLHIGDIDHLLSFTCPILAHLRDGRFVVITNISRRQIEFIDEETGLETTSVVEFVQGWSNIVLTVRARADASACSAQQSARSFRFALPSLTGICAAILFAGVADTRAAVAVVFMVMGFLLSAFLVVVESDDFAQEHRFCALGRHASCRVVLASRAAHIGPVGMSDVGIVYFGTMVLAWMLSIANSEIKALPVYLGVLGVVPLPYTVFSVAYQALGVKRWCSLCVGVQLILVVSAIWLWTMGGIEFPWWEPRAIGLVLLMTSLVGGGWAFIRPLISSYMKMMMMEVKLARFERNPDVIALMLGGGQMSSTPLAPLEIIRGAADPKMVITAYISPNCSPCALAYAEIDQLLQRFGKLLQVRFRLVGGLEDPGRALLVRVAERLIAEDTNGAVDSIDLWYAARRIGRPIEITTTNMTHAIEATIASHEAFCRSVPVSFVPAIFVDRRPLPLGMQISSLGYLLEKLES